VLAAFTIPAVPKVREELFVRRMRQYVARFAQRRSPVKGIRSADQMHDLAQMARLGTYAATPLQQLERALHPLVTFVVLPLFALANAGVLLPEEMGPALARPVPMGVGLGLLVGKPVGVLLASFLMVRLAGARLGTGVTWRHMVGAGLLAGIGFTMSLFVNELAFPGDPRFATEAKLGILVASTIAGATGYLWLAFTARRHLP
jgi:NhaA family Na+:H+ antiporter